MRRSGLPEIPEIKVTGFHEPTMTSSEVLERKGHRFTKSSAALAALAVAVIATVPIINSRTAKEGQVRPIIPPTEATPSYTPNTTAPSTTTTEKPKSSSAFEYYTNGYRNKSIQDNVLKAGRRIIKDSETSQLGTFDFYNAQTNEWMSQDKSTTGWGWLHHNPQMGGSKDQVSVYAYRNSDGSFDINKGIHGLSIKQDGMPSVSFESPNINIAPITAYPERTGWNITVANGSTIKEAHELAMQNDDNRLSELVDIDMDALSLLDDYVRYE